MAGGECSNRKEGGTRADGTLHTACQQKRKRIACVAAMVAPHTCDLVRDAFGADNTGASRYLTLRCFYDYCASDIASS
jgi:hypothetical protein